MRTWIIGSSPDCDVVVAQPTVSGRHCRLSETADGYLLEDLGSSNGTYVNGERIASATCVSGREVITLGKSVPIPWPKATASQPARIIRIGRFADNDIVLEDQRVSAHHAQLIISGTETLIEDLGSGNGTFVNSRDQRVTRAVPLREQDIVFFGTLEVPAARLLPKRSVRDPIAVDSLPHVEAERVPEPVSGPTVTTPRLVDHWTIALLAQSPAIAILIVLIYGRHAGAAIIATNWGSVADAVAATTFALGLTAVWLGCSTAAWGLAAGARFICHEMLTGTKPVLSTGSGLLRLAGLCFAQVTVLVAIVYWGCGLKGSWLAMLGLLALATAVGLSFGLILSSLTRAPSTAAAVLLLTLLPMIALGGWIWPLRTSNRAVRMAAAAMPSRWAFEGLLELEADASPTWLPPGHDPSGAPIDLAEPYFPSATERMGPRAAALAVGGILASLVAIIVMTGFGKSRAQREDFVCAASVSS